MLRIRVTTAEATILETELITAGRRGLQCAFAFSDDWEGLAKTVIVRGVVKRDVVLVGDTITVPGECLEREQFPLHIGVYGANGEGEIVIPTIWADFGKIRPSARPGGISPDEITPDVVAQIQQNSSTALYLASLLTQRANNGEFNGKDGATGPQGAAGADGANGNSLWTTTEEPMPASGGEAFTHLTGRSNVPPMVGDIIVRSSRYVYQVVDVLPDRTAIGYQIGDIKGEQGVSDAIWRSEVIELMYPSDYSMEVSDLVGRSGAEPKAGDLVVGPEPGGMDNPTPTHLYSIRTRYNTWVLLDDIGSIKGDKGDKGDKGGKGDTGATGPAGPAGPGVPAGGTLGQVLTKGFGGDYVTVWDDIPKQAKIFDFTVSGNTVTGPTWSEVDDLTLDYDILAVAKVDFDGQFVFLPCTFYEPPAAGHTLKIQFAGTVADDIVYIQITNGTQENTWLFYQWSIVENIEGVQESCVSVNQGSANAGKVLTVGSDGNVITQAVEENNSLAAFATDTASGAIASFTDGADDIPVKDLTVVIQPVQAGSGDPSPSNVRPISGWTGAEVTRTGINVWDEEWELGSYSPSTGEKAANPSTIRSKNPIPARPQTQYFAPLTVYNVFCYDADNNYLGLASYALGTTGYVWTTKANTRYIAFRTDSSYGTTYNHDISINYPSTDTECHEEHVQTIPITFPTAAGTVYGGTLDVTTGKLTVTHGQIASYAGESLPGEWISDRDVYAAGTTPTTGAQVVYALAEPVKYDLAPTEVNTLLGKNNIWADCGDVTVEYRADTKLYVDKKIAAIPSVPMWNGGSY